MFKNRELVYKFWALMDFIYLAGIASSLLLGMLLGARVYELFYFKLMMFSSAIGQGYIGIPFFKVLMPLLLGVSMIVSTVRLFQQHPAALRWVILQSPFRVYCLMPSLVFIPSLAGVRPRHMLAVWLLFAVIELIKINSLVKAGKGQCQTEEVK